MSIRVLVEEEYGNRHWMVTYPGTADQLIAAWLDGSWPRDLRRNPTAKEIARGHGPVLSIPVMVELQVEHDATAHVHEAEDSWLKVVGLVFQHRSHYVFADLNA